jgi:Protein of unknown function (DUF2950)
MKREIINMFRLWLQKVSGRARSAMVPLAFLGMWPMSGVGLAQRSAQPSYPSATEASRSLFQAVQGGQEQDITNILGGPSELASSRDDALDKVDRQLFVEKYQEMHRLGRDADGTMTLYIGAENWPFPIPLVQKNGGWRFDPDAGSKEVLFRRIGDNEFMAMAICHEFVAREKGYRASANTANPADSFPASLAAKAAGNSTSGDPVLFHGYYFQVLATSPASGGNKSNGKFVFVAYPAEYRSSGVMTFFVTGSGVVYEKDLGSNTPALAKTMATFHKDSSWHVADQ